MKIAVVGCGFVSYLYGGTLLNHEILSVQGAFDLDQERARKWTSRFGGKVFRSLDEVLTSDIDIVANLTNPEAHYEVTKASLLAGKHVYSEKPMTTDVARARELVQLAEAKGLQLECAPTTLLGETAQTIWRAIDEGVVGRIHTVYASFQIPFVNDVGIRRDKYLSFRRGGAVRAQYESSVERDFPVEWPIEDEMDIGCAYEHAGYALSWLTTWFGPVTGMTNHTTLRRPEVPWFKLTQDEFLVHKKRSPDLFVSSLHLADDVEVVMMNSTITRWDMRMQLYGQTGCIEIADPWNYRETVWIHREDGTTAAYPHVRPANFQRTYADWYRPHFDYARGIAELARSVAAGRRSPHTLSLEQQVHIQEVVDRVTDTASGSAPITSSFSHRAVAIPGPERTGVALLGCGDVAKSYLAGLRREAACEVVGVLSLSGRAERGRTLLGDGAREKVYGSLDEVLADPRVDLVVNLSDPARHAELTLASLERGKHVYSEKPLALTLADALAIQTAARAQTVRVGCAPSFFLLPGHVAATHAIKERLIGEVARVTVEVNHGAIETWHPNPAPLYGIGMHVDVGLYVLAAITSALGPIWKVSATGKLVTPTRTMPDGTAFTISTPDLVEAQLKLWSGVDVTIKTNSWSTERSWYKEHPLYIEYHGDRGVLRLEGLSGGKATLRETGDGPARPFEVPPGGPAEAYPFWVGAADMVQAIRGQRAHRSSVEHAVHMVEVVSALNQTIAGGGTPVTIKHRFIRPML